MAGLESHHAGPPLAVLLAGPTSLQDVCRPNQARRLFAFDLPPAELGVIEVNPCRWKVQPSVVVTICLPLVGFDPRGLLPFR